MAETRNYLIVKRALLAVVCLIVAPILGVWAGASMANPPGNGPGAGQVVVGVVVPLCVALAATIAARLRRSERLLWTFGSVTLTGALVLFLVWFVHTYLPS
jgi:hypothetical protein